MEYFTPVMYVDRSGHFPILACLVGILLSGVIVGTSAMLNKQEDESALGAFVGGFIDGAIGAVAVAAGLAVPGLGGVALASIIGAGGGFLGNTIGQLISYGDVDLRAAGIQALYSGITAGLSTGVLQMTKLFPTTGNFKVDFVNNLALWSGPNTLVHMGGAGSIATAVTFWFTYYGFPSANMIRKF